MVLAGFADSLAPKQNLSTKLSTDSVDEIRPPHTPLLLRHAKHLAFVIKSAKLPS